MPKKPHSHPHSQPQSQSQSQHLGRHGAGPGKGKYSLTLHNGKLAPVSVHLKSAARTAAADGDSLGHLGRPAGDGRGGGGSGSGSGGGGGGAGDNGRGGRGDERCLEGTEQQAVVPLMKTQN
ncbi:zinc finger protein ZIC 2-like [Drosophila ficusphila]|uniref:zinc finger protein ZIC 2-like n=1 Tax=Drosophila ficusphila TaxID=30025 RepID=UPI001C892E56|nr:zinc finger protein ZIC 2-like [Drosophila ficusphila]